MFSFLSNYQVEPKMNNPYTHSSYNGKLWNIPDDKLDEFYNLYTEYIKNELTDEYPSIVEYHTNKIHSPITIDIDIKQTMKNRQFDSLILKEIYDEFKGYLDEIFTNDTNYTCYMLLRNKPYLDQKSGLFKDGIHMYFPYIVTTYEFQFKLRQQMMPILKDIMKNIENKNSIEDTYDEAVIKKNGMFLFMSTKPKTKPYKIYKIYNMDNELINDDIRNILNVLSLRNKTIMTEYKNEKIKEEYEVVINILQKKTVNNIKNDSDNEIDKELNKYLCNVSEQEMSDYIDILPDVYCDDYNKWLVIGAILHNTDPKFKEIFRDFSQKSDKYNTNDFEKMWESYSKFNGEKVTFASLVEIFKQNDLMDEYRNIKDRYKEKNENNIRENRFKECIKSNKKHFDKNSPLSIKNMYVNSKMLCGATLSDRHCPCIKGKHDKSYTTMNLINSGMLYQYCGLCEKMFPSDGVKIEMSIINNIFGNTINNITNNYGKEPLDDVEFDESLVIYEDKELNKAIINALNGNGSHYDIAELIFYLKKNEYNYNIEEKEWYTFENHRWQKSAKIRNFISKELVDYFKETKKICKNDKKSVNKINKLMESLKKTPTKNNILTELVEIYKINNNDFYDLLDVTPYLICFNNGVYDLNKMEFRDGKPEDYISMTTGYDFPLEYTEHKENVINFFEDIQPNKQERDYLLTYLSLALTGLNELELFSILSGSQGRNGKSKLIELIKHTFGDYYSSISSKLLTKERPMANSPDPGLLFISKKRLIIGSEPEKKDKLNSGFIKFLTGNDETLLRNCHSNNIKIFKPNFITLLICNDIPEVDDMDNAFSKRLKVISFETEFVENPIKSNEKKIDTKLASKLPLWKQDFMLILIQYYKKYLDEGLHNTEKINSWTNSYKEETDMYLQYLNERTRESDKHVFMMDIYLNFRDWFVVNYPTTRLPSNKEILIGIKKYKTVDKTVHIQNKTSTGIKYTRIVNDNEL